MGDKIKIFGCDNCGHKLEAYPPDDSYTNFFLKACCEKSMERKIECDNCDFVNTRFWCVPHPAVAGGIFGGASRSIYDEL